ncbi:MAG TPA: DUF3078 domain-containing protein [Bacteroidia bacterium]|nr:DUF3078 domain-containing protein [Bacteroidia bacterium]
MTKRLLTLILSACLLLSFGSSSAQEDTTKAWTKSGVFGLNFSQSSFSNWAAGGENSVALNSLFIGGAHYKKNKMIWENDLELAFGEIYQKSTDWRKSDDKIAFSSKVGYKAFKDWYYAAILGFKTQFAKGYNYPNDSIAISNFLAPAYLNFGLGLDYKPNDNFSCLIAPANLRLIIVNDQDLADVGAYGVDPAEYDGNNNIVKKGEKTRTEIGGLIRIQYAKDLLENVALKTKLELFSNYIEEPQNIDVLWDVLLSFKVNQYINATLNTSLIYDDNTLVAIDDNGDDVPDRAAPRTQFKEVFGLGFSYKF